MSEIRAVIGCNDTPETAGLAAKVVALLKDSGIAPCCVDEDAERVDGAEAISREELSRCTHIVTVGGDGTILKWGKAAARYGLPLLGVNTGRLGFMATVEPSEIALIPGLLREGTISRRMLLECEILREGAAVSQSLVMNDVVLSRDSGSKLPEFCIFCGDSEVSRIRADGVILSTPTGSTAYSLSAGGPILSPELQCIEFTALCPHTLFNRPMVFSAEKTVSAAVRNYQRSSVSIMVDGGDAVPFGENETLTLRRSDKTLMLIEAGGGFYEAVHSKLVRPLK